MTTTATIFTATTLYATKHAAVATPHKERIVQACVCVDTAHSVVAVVSTRNTPLIFVVVHVLVLVRWLLGCLADGYCRAVIRLIFCLANDDAIGQYDG